MTHWIVCTSVKPMKMNEIKPVFLVGFMGGGKTTWGRKLATKTGRAFIDLDDVIVTKIGMPIADYFTQYGEPAFRQIESQTLKNLPLDEPAVVSTGGGTPCSLEVLHRHKIFRRGGSVHR